MEDVKSSETVNECGEDAQKYENAKRDHLRWVAVHKWDFGDGREEEGADTI
jgi:hypothetical protein